MGVLEVLPEVVGTKELFVLGALVELVHLRQVFHPLRPIRLWIVDEL